MARWVAGGLLPPTLETTELLGVSLEGRGRGLKVGRTWTQDKLPEKLKKKCRTQDIQGT